ncbi:MAG: hypothetical protein WAZ27_02315 [Minisyncoccia bacterium]
MTDEEQPVNFEEIRESIASATIAAEMGEAILFCHHFHTIRSDFLTELEQKLEMIDQIVIHGAGDTIAENLRIDPEVLAQVGDHLLDAKGAFKAAREALGSCESFLEATATILLQELRKKIRDQDPKT